MKTTTIKQLKIGDFFTLKPCEEAKESNVLVRGIYDRSSKTFECYKFSDVNHIYLFKANRIVYTDFIF